MLRLLITTLLVVALTAAAYAGGRIDAGGEVGRTALIRSALHGHGPMLGFLLERGADVNAYDKRGRSSLIRAASIGREDMLAMLLDHGAGPHHAASRGHHMLGRLVADAVGRD